MAIQWADDFGRYGTGSTSRLRMLDGLPYAGIGTNGSGGQCVTDPDPNLPSGSVCFRVGQDFGYVNSFRVALPNPATSGETVGALARFWFSSLPGFNNSRPVLFEFGNDPANVRQCKLVVNTNGALAILGNSNTQLYTTTVPVITTATWNHVELVVNTSDGSGSVYVNGVSTLTWTADATIQGSVFNVGSHISLSSNSNIIAAMFMKDYVIWDSTGTQNNSVMGTVFVRRLKPTDDVTLGDWSPSTGSTGFNLLNKTTPNDTTYLSAPDTLPSADMRFNVENLSPDITSIRALISVIRSRKIDGGDGNIQTAVSPDGTNWDNGDDRPITSAFQYDFDISELNPATAAAWTPVAVDSAQLRIDRTV